MASRACSRAPLDWAGLTGRHRRSSGRHRQVRRARARVARGRSPEPDEAGANGSPADGGREQSRTDPWRSTASQTAMSRRTVRPPRTATPRSSRRRPNPMRRRARAMPARVRAIRIEGSGWLHPDPRLPVRGPAKGIRIEGSEEVRVGVADNPRTRGAGDGARRVHIPPGTPSPSADGSWSSTNPARTCT